MELPEAQVVEALSHAMHIANRCWNDPEAESVAGECLVNAIRTYDESKGSLRAWVTHHVVLGCTDFKRRKVALHSNTESEVYWEHQFVLDEEEGADIGFSGMTRYHWDILWEFYVDKVPLDTMARNRGIKRYEMRKLVDVAYEVLLESKY